MKVVSSLALLLILTAQANADTYQPDNSEVSACAAVLPCNEDGEIFDWAKGSPCEQIYRLACQSLALSSCRDESDTLTNAVKNLEEENVTLRKTQERLLRAIKGKKRKA